MEEKNRFEKLPKFVCLFIFNLLNWKDYIHLMFVCKKFKAYIDQNWEARYLIESMGMVGSIQQKETNWKDECIKLNVKKKRNLKNFFFLIF